MLFILATTEVHKIPATILSRCQRFDFGRISPEEMAKRLEFVAQRGKGSRLHTKRRCCWAVWRTALCATVSLCLISVLAQAAPSPKRWWRKRRVWPGMTIFFELSDAVFAKDTSAALLLIDRLHQASQDMSRLCEELISHFRAMMLIKTMSDPKALLVCSQQELARLQQAAQKNHVGRPFCIFSPPCKARWSVSLMRPTVGWRWN